MPEGYRVEVRTFWGLPSAVNSAGQPSFTQVERRSEGLKDSSNGHQPALRLNRAISAVVSEAKQADGDRVDGPHCLETLRAQGGTMPLRSAAILMFTLNYGSFQPEDESEYGVRCGDVSVC